MIQPLKQPINEAHEAQIFESIVTTRALHGVAHIAPFGIRWMQDMVVISPYRPSTTLQNILDTQCAVLNLTDDVRVFAAAIAKRKTFEVVDAQVINGVRLSNALVHHELKLDHVVEDTQRPQLWMKVVHSAQHGMFNGFNRAQAAVIELAVLVSRLHMLPIEKISNEMQYLQIAIDKTAGPNEREAWQWLVDVVQTYLSQQQGQTTA